MAPYASIGAAYEIASARRAYRKAIARANTPLPPLTSPPNPLSINGEGARQPKGCKHSPLPPAPFSKGQGVHDSLKAVSTVICPLHAHFLTYFKENIRGKRKTINR